MIIKIQYVQKLFRSHCYETVIVYKTESDAVKQGDCTNSTPDQLRERRLYKVDFSRAPWPHSEYTRYTRFPHIQLHPYILTVTESNSTNIDGRFVLTY